jgi:hypothetical protein
MTIIKNTYTGDGSTVIYSFTFPYLRQEHVKATINGTPTTLFTFANDTTLQFNTPPPNGAAVVIFRETESDELDNRFFPNSSIRAGALNSNFTQGLYVAQETQGEAGEATATANQALGDAASAIITANQAASDASAAVITANAADSAASSAVSTAGSAVITANAAVVTANNATNTANSAVITANAASSAASGAASTANSAVSTANAAVLTANAADSNASAAVLTANQADIDASAAVITANTADSNATAAIGIANGAVITANDADNTANNAESVANFAITTALAAQAAVAAVVVGTPVNDVAALLLLSPSDGDVFEIIDSTGVESEPSITSVPGGFVGDSGLAVSVIFVAATTEFEFISYRPLDPDARYAEVATEGIAASAQSDASQALLDAAAAQGDATQALLDAAAAQGDASNALGQLVNAVFDSDVRLTNERVPTNDSVTDAKVSSTAAIAGTKISPNFGSQAVSTTGGFTGSLTGNASTATTLQTARTINGVSFNGGTNITVTANTPNSVTPGSFLLGSSFDGSDARTFSVDATNAATPNTVVSRDGNAGIAVARLSINTDSPRPILINNTDAPTDLKRVRVGVLTNGNFVVSGFTDADVFIANDYQITRSGGFASDHRFSVGNGNEICRITDTEGLSINTFSANPGVDNTNVGIQLRTNGSFRASAGTFHSLNRNAVSRSNQPILEYRLQGSLVGTIRDYNSGDGIGFVADGTEKLYLEGNQVRSETIYDATSGSAANIFINSVGRMMRSTSSLKYKKDVEDLDPTYAYNVINGLRPVWFRAKGRPDMDEDARPTDSYWGLIAEEVHEVDPRLVSYAAREEGKREPEGVQYDRIIPHLLVVVKQQQTEINELKAQLAQLSS